MKKIGVIGVGNMGSAVAHNIQRANFPLYIYDIRNDVGDK
jgi:3-hydroxyacyl-CoA dehydrogenase